MEQIKIKNTKLNLNFENQLSPTGRIIRLSSISKLSDFKPIWDNKIEKWYWRYTYRFLDEIGGYISFDFDYNDNFVKTNKH